MKAILELGYKAYVMDAEKAVMLLSMLDQCEVYESKWEGKTTVHYIYPQDGGEHIRSMKILPDALYRMAKLAGKPNKGE